MSKKNYYSDKPLWHRIIFFITGFTNFIIGYALYYLFKDDKSKDWQIEFIQRGAAFGFAFTIIGLVIEIINLVFNKLV